MIEYKRSHLSIMVLYAVVLHCWWAALIILDRSALHATGPAALAKWVHSPALLALVIAAAAICAVVAMFTERPWILLLLLPQQILLMAAAAGAVEAMWLAQFADGVIRTRAFIAADQAPSVFGAVGHTVAMIFHTIRFGQQRPGNAAR